MKNKITIQDILVRHFPEYELIHDLPSYVLEAAQRLIDCRTSALGGHKYYCPECDKEEIVYNPCHHRICPQCSHIAKDEWLKVQTNRMIATNYYHVVFTIPSEFNMYWLKNKKIMTDILFESVKETLLQMCGNEELLGVLPGIIATLHTWGSTLALHPHIHCLITDGGLTKDGKWKRGRRGKESKKGFLLPIKSNGVMGVFRAKFIFKMIGSLRRNKLVIPIEHLNKTTKEIESIYSKLKDKKWNVDIRERYQHGNGVAKYLANYLKGGAIGNSRIKSCKNEQVTFSYKNSRKNRKKELMTLDVHEFIRRLLLHVPEKRQRLVRYYGIFSSNKKHLLNKARNLFGQPAVKKIEKIKKEVICKTCGHKLRMIDEIEPIRRTNILNYRRYKMTSIKKAI